MNQPLAYIHPNAHIAEDVKIEAFAWIGEDVEIGSGTWIGPNATIMDGARIGKNCKIFPGAVISAIPQDLKYKGCGQGLPADGFHPCGPRLLPW